MLWCLALLRRRRPGEAASVGGEAFPDGRTALHPPTASMLLAGVCVLLGFVGALGAYFVAEAGLTAETAIAVGTILLALATFALAYFTSLTALTARDQMAMLQQQKDEQRLAEKRAFLVQSLATTRTYAQHLQRMQEWLAASRVHRAVRDRPSMPDAASSFSFLIYEAERWRGQRFYDSFQHLQEAWEEARRVAERVDASEQKVEDLLPVYAALRAAVSAYREVAVEDVKGLPPEMQ